ncbi:MAG: acyl-CoA carboxylase subunit beta [FCB group bacterium]|nr:acyl-CoA carboxylase subunit beta [FCB group bacterium]
MNAHAAGARSEPLRAITEEILAQETLLREGGGAAGRERQQRLGRLTARDRLALLLDPGTAFLELGLWAAHGMYDEVGAVPAAGVVAGIGPVCGRPCMLVANDATVKAGAFFPMTVKKLLRAQRIAFECNLPVIYLVDSAGVYLPMQDEIFPDEDDFGRIFRNNAVLSAAGVPQFAAIMGNCIAGGAYLPVLCDKLLMTEGSGLYLAGPALVKAAIGQVVEAEDLGGATMHAEISGTVDYVEPDDESCLRHLRSLVDMLPSDQTAAPSGETARDPHDVYAFIDPTGHTEYDAHDLLACIVDRDSFQGYKANYGHSLVTGYARIGGHAVGIVANQRRRVQSKTEGVQIGGVIYGDSADKAARFVMDCNQLGVPIVFLQDVVGFMVGRDAEQSGIIRRGAKLVNAVSNSIVPKITVVVGGSFGAGNYALCGKAYDPRFIFAWPNARYAVMGAEQAAETLFAVQKRTAKPLDLFELESVRDQMKQDYLKQMDIRYGAARGWVDAIIAPHTTRDVLITALALAKRTPPSGRFHTGVMQV